MPTHDAASAGALSTGKSTSTSTSNTVQQTAHDTSTDTRTMASGSASSTGGSTASSESDRSAQYSSISTSQKMISATWGSLLTSLLVTPLDVVRVRLQSQTPVIRASLPSPSTLPTPSPPPTTLTSVTPSPLTFFRHLPPNLGVTACCREVFWIGENAQTQFCLVNQPAPSASITTPSPSAPCVVEQRKSYTSTLDGLRKIARHEGPLSLWRGLSPTLVMAIPANVIYFTGYDWLRYDGASPVASYVPASVAPLVAGSVARIAAASAISPIEMFRTRLQAMPVGSGVHGSGHFKATLRDLGGLVRREGYTSLWRGLTLTMWRDVPFSGLYWWGYERIKRQLESMRGHAFPHTYSDPVLASSPPSSSTSTAVSSPSSSVVFVESFTAGAVSGALSALVTTPFDVGKTRQQVSAGASSSIPRFLLKIVQDEGIAGLFRGWAARCLKVAPACAIMISSYEVGKQLASDSHKEAPPARAVPALAHLLLLLPYFNFNFIFSTSRLHLTSTSSPSRPRHQLTHRANADAAAMPRPSLTSSFSVSDATNEVVCPLANNDGSNCRKRCLGEKRYRSMQEHIRRAHPNHYIPKLPATEESFQLMVNTPPQQQQQTQQQTQVQAREKDVEHPAATTAAVALAQLQQHHRLDWDSEPDDTDIRSVELPPIRDLRDSFHPRQRELLPSILHPHQHQQQHQQHQHQQHSHSHHTHSPPGRSSTLPPIHRSQKIQRSRKGSLTHSQSARKAKHDRNRSKDFKDFRDITRRRSLNERKALSAEPQTAAAWVQGKRWEDLIEAATSATEVDDRDITPVPQSPPPTSSSSFQPLSPSFRSLASLKHRSSVPPAFQSPTSTNPNSTSITSQPTVTSHPLQPPYTASPLQKSLTPPPFHRERDTDLEPFPSIESSMDVTKPYLSPPRPVTSYPQQQQQQQHIYQHPHPHPHAHHPLHPLHPRHRLSNPTPFTSTSASTSSSSVSVSRDKDLHIHIYCASCSRPRAVRDCFACTECICGVCRDCIPSLSLSMHSASTSASTVGAMGISVLNLGPTSSPRAGGGGSPGGVNRLARSNSTNTTMSNHSSVNANGKSDGRQGRGCPRCGIVGGKWRAFQLDFR
ncbi:transcription factor RfeD [Arthroderma uncinatum]|uniref:transcription factor RfeD n=1 Tax=Arthroderma uncinatum TaxID=74035 RepID=UPI00144AA2F4|nr:transcription factor RfeD [Arthroderma uncinatum]KAF3480370.1 transcription factor RfeD [Arthroderma uncinatum]